MKRIIFMLIILLLAACEAQSPKKNAIIQSDPVSSGDVIAFTMTDGYVYEYKFNTNLVRQLFAVPVWIRGM